MEKEEKQIELLLVDGSALLHRAYHAYPDLTSKNGKPVNAVYGVASMLVSALEEIDPEYVVVAWDLPKPTFRHKKFIGYKAQRPKTDEELIDQIPTVKEMIEAFGVKQMEMEGYEADDIIGSLGDKYKNSVDKVVVLTGDQDMMQLVEDKIGILVPGRGRVEQILYGRDEVLEKYSIEPSQIVDYKALIGDPSDNIPGLAGVGPKTAVRLLNQWDSLDKIYANLGEVKDKMGERVYSLLEKSKDSAYLSKELAQIKRDIEITDSLEDYALGRLDNDEVREFLERVNFRSIIRRLFGEEKKSDDRQMGLF